MINRLFRKSFIKRVTSFVLLSLFFINSFPRKVHAINIYSEGELKQIVYSNVNKINTRVVGYNTQRGIFINFRNLVISSLWVQFIYENGANVEDETKKVVFNDTDKNFYYLNLVEKIKDLNRIEGTSTSNIMKVSIPVAPASYDKNYMGYLFAYIRGYLDEWYTKMLSEYNSKPTDEDKLKYLDENKLTITSAYEVLIDLSQEYDFMLSVSLTQDSLVNFNPEVAAITDILKKSEYQPLFDCAIKQIEKGVNIGDGIKVSVNSEKTRRNQIIQMLTEKDNSDRFTDKVNQAYLAILASSSVYIPFKSKLGDDSFRQALSYIAEGDSKDKILEIYGDAGALKKPLYFTSFHYNQSTHPSENDFKNIESGVFSNTAERLSLGLLVELIRDKAEGAIITGVGGFQPSIEDPDTFSMFQGYQNEINSGEKPSDAEEEEEEVKENKEQSSLSIPLLMCGTGFGNSLLGNYNISLLVGSWSPINWLKDVIKYKINSSKSSSSSTGQTTIDSSNIPDTSPNHSSSNNPSSTSNSNPSTNNNSDSKGDDPSNDLDSGDKSNNKEEEDLSSISDMLQYGKEVPLSDSISGKENFTNPIMLFKRNGMSGINYVLLKNILAEGNEGETGINLKDNSIYSTMLYVTPFGDIVTGDNTVVVPGAANATFYNFNEDILYYPFTDAFMSTYPSIYSKKDFSVSSKDIGRTFLYLPKWDEFWYGFNPFSSATINEPQEVAVGYIKGVDKVGKEFWANGTNVATLEYSIYDPNTGESYPVFEPQKKNFKSFHTGMVNASSYIYTINTNVLTSDGLAVPLYPYTNAVGDDAKARSQFIVRSFYTSLMVEGDGSIGGKPNQRMDRKYLRELMINTIDGRKSVIGYERSVQNERALIDNDDSGIIWKINLGIKTVANAFVNIFGDAPGMLGLRSATQDGFMGKVIYFSYKAFPFISVFIVVVLLALYTRQRMGLVSSIFYTFCGLFGVYVLIYLAPKYLADITNFLPNNGSNKLAIDSLILRQEVFRENGSIKPSYSDFGKFSYAESSITLYNFKDEQLEEVCKTYGQELDNILSGGSFVIDESSGLFVQGYKLKMSLDKLFDGVSIEGGIDSVSNFAVYKLEKKNYVDSVINYYTPFNLIADGLINKLNCLSRVYLLTRSQLPYPNNQVKDAFFMDSYVKSPIFISPREPWAMDEDMTETTKALIENYFMTTELGNEDFIGIYDSLSEYIENGKALKTLWYQTMQQNGYFDEDIGPKLLSNLIVYVNNNTREFLVRNIDKLPYVSDETWVEVTSLYATMLFNTQVSQYYNKLYPERINYEELGVVDTLRPIITKDYNRFSQSSRDIVDYVSSEYGFLGTVALACIVVLQGITSLILTYAIFIMYFLLIMFVVIKLFIKRDTMKSTITGFLKLYGTLVGVYFVNTWGLQILNKFDSSGLTLFFILVLSIVVSGFSGSVVMYTITGFSSLDFANDRSMRGMFNFADKLTFGLLKGITNSTKSRVNSLMAKKFSSSTGSGMDKRVNVLTTKYSAYEDARNIDSFIEDRYKDDAFKSTEDFYNRNVRFRRSERMKARVNLDIQDDGDFLN